METLAYLHLELSYDAPTDTTDVFCLESLQLFEWLKQQKLATHARIYLLSLVAMSLVLGTAGEALAQKILRLGDRGSEVTFIQDRLRELGYFNRSSTGIFGEQTRDAVIQFQQDSGLFADGIVGPRTEAALLGSERRTASQPFNASPYSPLLPTPYPPPPTTTDEPITFGTPISTNVSRVLERGDRGPEVTKLQQELRRRGFSPGRIDGVYGSQTERAVRDFQRVNGLLVDGVAGQDTLTALGILPGSESTNRYVVVVPGDRNTLNRVNQVLQEKADLRESRRGSYVNAGAFPDRDSAESRSFLLRARGFDARVVYLR